MHKFWSVTARVFAVIFAALFVGSAMISLFLTNINRRLFTASTYISVLNRQQVYTRLPQVIAEQLVLTDPMGGSAGDVTGTAAFMKNIDVTDWENIITSLVPPDVLSSNTETFLVQLFAYLNGNQDSVSISWVPLKNRLASPAGLDSLLVLIRDQPSCSVLQLAQMELALRGTPNASVLCRPPEIVLNLMTPAIRSVLDSAVSQLPDQTTILSPATGNVPGNAGMSGNGPSAKFRRSRLWMLLSPDFPIGFLLLVTLLAVRNLKDLLHWWGIPLFISGGISFASAVIALLSYENIWEKFVTARIPDTISAGVVSLAHDLIHALLQVLLGGILIEGLLFILIGLAMWIGAAFIRNTAKAKPPIPAPNLMG